MHNNNNFQETDSLDDEFFEENTECEECEECEESEDYEDLNNDYDDFFNDEDDEEDEENEPYDDGEPWDEDKWDDYFNQNLKAGERADMENNTDD